MICRGCGGVAGRDCFNPPECEWIAQDMARRSEARYYEQMEAAYYAEREQAMWDEREADMLIDYLAAGKVPVVIGHA